MKLPSQKSSEHDGPTTSPLLPPQDVSSEKLPDTPEARPTTSEAVKHEREVPSVPCTTATTSSNNFDCSAPEGKDQLQKQAHSCISFKAIAGSCFASGEKEAAACCPGLRHNSLWLE